MSDPIPLRQDFDAPGLRGLAKETKNAPQARRLLALAAIYDGATRRGGEDRWRWASDHSRLGAAVQWTRSEGGCWMANRQASPRNSMIPSAKRSRR